jgi:GcrA cell cycle regulator
VTSGSVLVSPDIAVPVARRRIGGAMPGEVWTAERVKLLRSLWTKGATAAAIGVRLGGLSRSAVLGKIYRLRLDTDQAPLDAPAKSRLSAKKPSSGGLGRRRRRTRYKKRKPEVPAPGSARQNKSIFELTNITCRWPQGCPGSDRFFFCGAPEADLEHGIPYCAGHMQRAYPNGVSAKPLTRVPGRKALSPCR